MPHTPSEPTSLKEITKNELNPCLLGVIVGRYPGGKKTIDIQRSTGLFYSTINATVEKNKTSTTRTRNSDQMNK